MHPCLPPPPVACLLLCVLGHRPEPACPISLFTRAWSFVLWAHQKWALEPFHGNDPLFLWLFQDFPCSACVVSHYPCIFTVFNTHPFPEDWHLQLKSPHWTRTHCGLMWACELLLGWKLPLCTMSLVNFPHFVSFYFLLMFLSLPRPCLRRGFLLCRSFSYFRDPSPGQGSTFWNPLSLFLSISFVLPYSREFDLPFWTSGFLCQPSKVVLWELFHMQMIFWCICGGEGGFPLLFLHHLEATTVGENLKELVGSYTAHWNIKCIFSLRSSFLTHQFLKNLKIQLPNDPVIPLPGIYLREKKSCVCTETHI